MAAYTHEYSHFPDALITLKHYKDVTDEMQVLLTPTENTSRTDSMIRQPPTQKGTVISLTHVL